MESLGGHKYFLSLIDDYSRMTWIFIMKHKSDAFKNFKRLQTDNGLEFFFLSEFNEFCKTKGISRHHTLRNTTLHNGVAEHMNQTLLDKAWCMLLNAGLNRMFWVKVVNTSCYLINHGPHTGVNLKTPYELWSGKSVDYSNLRVFGSIV